jgi:RNA polymerase sigma-70 factor (ECF subfamily)
MLSICLRYVNDLDFAKEILNDGFYKVLSNIKKFENKGSFEGWVKRIMNNTAIDFLRKNKKHLATLQMEKSNEINHSNSSNEGLENLLESDLLNLFHELPSKTKKVFGLFAVEGYKHKEISELLTISVETSKWHVREARKYLKERIMNLKLI